MKETFVGCTNLKTPPSLIPESVDNLNKTFMDCSILEGKLSINANPSIYENCFYGSAINSKGVIITGNSNLLEQIINTKSLESNIMQE